MEFLCQTPGDEKSPSTLTVKGRKLRGTTFVHCSFEDAVHTLHCERSASLIEQPYWRFRLKEPESSSGNGDGA